MLPHGRLHEKGPEVINLGANSLADTCWCCYSSPLCGPRDVVHLSSMMMPPRQKSDRHKPENYPVTATSPKKDVQNPSAMSEHAPTSNGIHKRELPSTGLTAFSSPEGRKMLRESMANGSAEAYFPLSEQFLTQSNPPSCGPATIALVLNSLAVNPQQDRRAPWRWYTEDALHCRACTQTDLSNGVNMEEFAHLATCNYLKVQKHYAKDKQIGVDEFRREVRRICCDHSSDSRIVAAFSRAQLGQTGSGHYSPIGAYHEESDSILIMDVARFKYSPFWVPLERLWAAMEDIDPMTSEPRGFFILHQQDSLQETVYTVSGEMHSGRCGHVAELQRNSTRWPIQTSSQLNTAACAPRSSLYYTLLRHMNGGMIYAPDRSSDKSSEKRMFSSVQVHISAFLPALFSLFECLENFPCGQTTPMANYLSHVDANLSAC